MVDSWVSGQAGELVATTHSCFSEISQFVFLEKTCSHSNFWGKNYEKSSVAQPNWIIFQTLLFLHNSKHAVEIFSYCFKKTMKIISIRSHVFLLFHTSQLSLSNTKRLHLRAKSVSCFVYGVISLFLDLFHLENIKHFLIVSAFAP